ncbi:MAG: amidophosphoribosyltransferase, partial [Xanthobacteraceae bacterium]
MTDTPSDAGLDLGRGRTDPTSADREASSWGGSELDGDRLREECGVFGIFGHPDAAAITALGLHALQHRGQEAAGIVSFDGKRFHSERRMGLVGDNFSRREVIERLPGMSAMGHVRYSTTGETILRNVQPLFAELDGGGLAIGHNGNLTNGLTLRRQLVRDGAIMQSTSDTEVILHLVANAKRNRFIDRFIEGLRQLEGAYAFVGLTNKKLVGARDPLGIRPLVIGKLDGQPILASETCALDIIGAKYVRDVENGEVVVFDEDGMHSHKPFPPMAARPCIFEYIYFARPDSVVGGRNVYDVRKTMGAQLAREAPAAADVVIPVPDSGVPAAIGYAQESGIPYELGIIRNHYIGRTFIEPSQQIRQLGVRLKHSANRAVVNGKRIVLIDDSIVRGTTSVKIVQMMRDAGAREVHFRIASPPITHSDYYGIDTPERDKLLAANHDLEGMRSFIGADSLAFLSVEG